MTPEKMSGELSPEQINPQEKLKSAIEESLLHTLSTEQDKDDNEEERDFFERFFSYFNEIHPNYAGEEDKSKYNNLLNLRNEIEFIEKDLKSGVCKTKEEAIEKFFDNQTVKESLGL